MTQATEIPTVRSAKFDRSATRATEHDRRRALLEIIGRGALTYVAMIAYARGWASYVHGFWIAFSLRQ